MNGDTLRYGLTPTTWPWTSLEVDASGAASPANCPRDCLCSQLAADGLRSLPRHPGTAVGGAYTPPTPPTPTVWQPTTATSSPWFTSSRWDRNVRRPRQQQPLTTIPDLYWMRWLPYLPRQERLDAGRTPAIPVRTESHRKTRGVPCDTLCKLVPERTRQRFAGLPVVAT